MNRMTSAPRWRVALLVAGAWLLPPGALAAGTGSVPTPILQTKCSFSGMLDELRGALKTGSPAYRKYARERLKLAVIALPADELRAAVEYERDPDMLEVLGNALASKASREEDPSLVQTLLQRAAGDGDPKLRAAALKGLRGTGSVEFMAKNGNAVSYEQLIRDNAPEVRAAVVDNLLHESGKVYFGHDATVSETAVSTALASKDPEAAAKLLSEVSMEQVGHGTVEQLKGQLRAESPTVRAATAKALGGVPAGESGGSREALLQLYRTDSDPTVRKAALQGLVQLGMGSALPTLESLRGVDAALAPEIDAWEGALRRGLQEWHLVLREKQRLRP